VLTVASRHSSTLWPPFAEAVSILAQWVEYRGLTAFVTEGYRSLERQEELYAKGRTPLEIRNRVKKRGANGAVTDAPPGSSAHNYGLAIDVAGPDLDKVVELARSLGFGTVSWDRSHIEWPNWQALLRGPGST